MVSVDSGPERGSSCRTHLVYLKRAVSAPLILNVRCALLCSSDFYYKGHAKAKFLQDVIDIRVSHTVVSRELIEG
jgi:hypothetical protein